MTRPTRRVILKRRAKDLFYLPCCHRDEGHILVDEILATSRKRGLPSQRYRAQDLF
ncbi:MAG: hypothetical protein ABI718_10855 [Acidobacteriota bacterium]